jgi:hypothetical protein
MSDIDKLIDAFNGEEDPFIPDLALSDAERIEALEEALRYVLEPNAEGIVVDHPSEIDKTVIIFQRELGSIHIGACPNPFTAVGELRLPFKSVPRA